MLYLKNNVLHAYHQNYKKDYIICLVSSLTLISSVAGNTFINLVINLHEVQLRNIASSLTLANQTMIDKTKGRWFIELMQISLTDIKGMVFWVTGMNVFMGSKVFRLLVL